MAFNKAIIIGNLTADPELKQTPSGKDVTSFTVAVERSRSGENRETDFIPVVAWGKTAEFIARYFRKGKPILVEGRIQVRRWKDKADQSRTTTEIVADAVSFVGGKDAGEPASQAQAAPKPYGEQIQLEEWTDDVDLPF